MEQFDSTLSSVIDSILGLRCSSFGYHYNEIIRSLMSIYFCGGSCIEDVTSHLMNHLYLLRQVLVEDETEGEIHKVTCRHIASQGICHSPKLCAQFLLQFFAHIQYQYFFNFSEINNIDCFSSVTRYAITSGIILATESLRTRSYCFNVV